MNIEEAILYLKHTSKDDFNLEEHQKVNRYEAIQVVLEEIERLNNIIKTKDEGIKAFTEDLCETTEELEKAKDIINDLEKTLKGLIKEQEEGYKKYPENWGERKSVSNTWLRSRDCYLCIYNYLQKLKGSEKE